MIEKSNRRVRTRNVQCPDRVTSRWVQFGPGPRREHWLRGEGRRADRPPSDLISVHRALSTAKRSTNCSSPIVEETPSRITCHRA